MTVDRAIPKGVLLLHTPWLLDPLGEYTGAVTDKNLVQCNKFNEVNGDTPIVEGMYLVWGGGKPTFDSKPNVEFRKHVHSIGHSHSHSQTYHQEVTHVDANNIGKPLTVANGVHSHSFELNHTEARIGNTDPEAHDEDIEIHHPEHYQINAYYCLGESKGAAPVIPIGTIVFGMNVDVGPGWLSLVSNQLPKKTGDHDFRPKPWKEVFFRVAGCFPDRELKGKKTHSHPSGTHIHTTAGEYSSASGGLTHIDDSIGGGIDSVAVQDHKHKFRSIVQGITKVGEAENAPLNLSVQAFVCVDNTATWHPGMMLPFLPRTEEEYLHIPGWTFRGRPGSDDDPLFIRTGKNDEDFNNYTGSTYHSHTYEHSHSIVLGPSEGEIGHLDGEHQVSCAPSNHWHYSDVFHKEVSSESQNELPWRPVSFIFFGGKN